MKALSEVNRSVPIFFLLFIVSISRLDVASSFGIPWSKPSLPIQEGAIDGDYHELDTRPNRRFFLQSFSLGGAALIALPLPQSIIGGVEPAHAAYGDTSNMELPNYIEFLLEKNAVADPDAFLYKGPDPKVQLERLLEASRRLQDIPSLADDKKWSQVQGILTGPLGTLAQTLNAIAKDAPPPVQAKAKQVKTDILNISQAATQKNQAEVVTKTSAAVADLEAFVKAAF